MSIRTLLALASTMGMALLLTLALMWTVPGLQVNGAHDTLSAGKLGAKSTIDRSQGFQGTGGVVHSATIAFSPSFTAYLPLVSHRVWHCATMTRVEASYILACQYLNPGHAAHGAINNVFGTPTWVVPSENAMAILGLIHASETLSDLSYFTQAQRTADYLLRVQQADGAWCNQYDYATCVDPAKDPRQTAEVMMALHKLGYDASRSNAMRQGATYLMECQRVANKGGQDDGLLGGGKDADGHYRSWRWTHDNAYAYWALKAAEDWASLEGDPAWAAQCAASAELVLNGIDEHLYNPSTGGWHIVIDQNGTPQWLGGLAGLPNWIQFSPQMLDLPATGVNSPTVGQWIHDAFQQEDGSCVGYAWEGGAVHARQYPGLCFMAALCWFDTGHIAYADAALAWALGSGLWQSVPDANDVTGGWVDWYEVTPGPGKRAAWWERFIDTSFYASAGCNRGYGFGIR